ncbi:hypothetical protein V6Z11_1Z065700 [Gossypium hirsutum]
MITCDIDPDVAQWGLQDIQVCVYSHSGASCSVTQYEKFNSQTVHIREGCYEPECVNVENDAVIAHALQEELSRVAAAEASGFTNPSRDSILSQDWFGLQGRQHSSGTLFMQYELGGNYGMGDTLIMVKNMLRIDTIDESSVLMHVPKINGDIPSVDEEISDHQRLLDRLLLYGLVENKVHGDGNCQFRSLSDQLYRSQDHHRFVRQQVVSQLKSNPEMYEGYVPMAYGDYLKKMNNCYEEMCDCRKFIWFPALKNKILHFISNTSYGVKIFVLTSFKDTCYIEILPHYQKSERSKIS